jgi:site-specific DNA-methyltransferase (adenine-specific)
MRYLVRLITPPGGTVLDPFAGSGTTLQAAWELGMNPTGCEAEAEYQADIRRRMEACQVQRDIFLHGAA